MHGAGRHDGARPRPVGGARSSAFLYDVVYNPRSRRSSRLLAKMGSPRKAGSACSSVRRCSPSSSGSENGRISSDSASPRRGRSSTRHRRAPRDGETRRAGSRASVRSDECGPHRLGDGRRPDAAGAKQPACARASRRVRAARAWPHRAELSPHRRPARRSRRRADLPAPGSRRRAPLPGRAEREPAHGYPGPGAQRRGGDRGHPRLGVRHARGEPVAAADGLRVEGVARAPDQYPEQAFYMVGAIEEVAAKAQKMAAETSAKAA